MIMRTYLKPIAAVAVASSILLPLSAFAQVGAAVDASANVTTPAGSIGASATVTAKMKTAITHADQEIDRRSTALNDLVARVNAMERVTPAFKTSLTANIQTQLTALVALKAKIDADTDATVLKADIKSITDSYRIFALVIPQSRIAAAADREVTIITMMNTLGAKLQARIQAQQSSGANVSTLLAALTDMSAKLTDANTQAQAAVSVSATLTPDEGDKTKMDANTAALKTGRSDIQAAQKDLVAARKDVTTILAGLKASSSATSTTAATTTTKTP